MKDGLSSKGFDGRQNLQSPMSSNTAMGLKRSVMSQDFGSGPTFKTDLNLSGGPDGSNASSTGYKKFVQSSNNIETGTNNPISQELEKEIKETGLLFKRLSDMTSQFNNIETNFLKSGTARDAENLSRGEKRTIYSANLSSQGTSLVEIMNDSRKGGDKNYLNTNQRDFSKTLSKKSSKDIHGGGSEAFARKVSGRKLKGHGNVQSETAITDHKNLRHDNKNFHSFGKPSEKHEGFPTFEASHGTQNNHVDIYNYGSGRDGRDGSTSKIAPAQGESQTRLRSDSRDNMLEMKYKNLLAEADKVSKELNFLREKKHHDPSIKKKAENFSN